MPKMDGYELVKLLRKKDKTQLPIIAITAGNPETVESKCYEAGFTDIIFKPFRNEDFVERIAKFLLKDKEKKSEEKTSVLPAVKTKESAKKKAGPDFSTLDSISGGEAAIFNDLMKSIIENIRVEIPKLKKAIDTSDMKSIHFISHKIKTSYGYIGLIEDLDKLKQMEDLSEQEGKMPEIKSLFNSVFTAHIALLAQLKGSLR
jgi:CheY-like chemotaxis protein